jgi:hypothetical protein
MKNELNFQNVPCRLAKLQCLGMGGDHRFKVGVTWQVDLPRPALRRIREGRYALADLEVYASVMREYERECEKAVTVAEAAHAARLDAWKLEAEEAELQGYKAPKEPKRKDPELPDRPPMVEARRTVSFDAGERVELFVHYPDVDAEGTDTSSSQQFWATLKGGSGSLVVMGARVYLELNLQDLSLQGEELLRWAMWVKDSTACLKLSTGQIELPLTEEQDENEHAARKAAAQAELDFAQPGQGDEPSPADVFEHARFEGAKNALRDFANRKGLTVSVNGRQLFGGGE